MTAPVFQDITGIVLVGGKSRRMGQDKALLAVQGKTLVERALEPFQQAFAQVLLIGDRPERFAGCRLPVVPDLYPGSSLGGLYTGLYHARTEHVFVTSCDLPFPNPAILRYLCNARGSYDAVIPCSSQGAEPLFACYRKSCLDTMRNQLQEGIFSISTACSQLHVRQVPYPDIAPFDPAGTAFLNLNTPEDITLLS
ncbi:molybdenum cofactor guanylyltransferase [Trichlorobacter lovleyi]|uniref:molybdenum cofactor guanylyltransferase n=1 Tax=Trichlorobacter lovleyi TaxID=313985 RepID=UPI00223F5188|nr:molybdenum cofactor guanylyltransferase [Trichlorobacter lovleyi]QOX78064.1 molybdenum cofactor guanylyltransferase [Trichlorobacter lovleyi]